MRTEIKSLALTTLIYAFWYKYLVVQEHYLCEL